MTPAIMLLVGIILLYFLFSGKAVKIGQAIVS